MLMIVKTTIVKRVIVLLLLVPVALTLTGCLGPDPVVRDYSVQASAQGSGLPYVVDVTLGNKGAGGGQVQLEVNLTDKRTGVIIAQQVQAVDLQKDQTIQVAVTLKLPQSARDLTPDDIVAHVDVHYPVE
jgi:YbbR domain-containing protein